MKNKKNGFTIVELVIVIAVIAMLAIVLIPTFSGVIEKAKYSAAYQECANEYKKDKSLGKPMTSSFHAQAQNFTAHFHLLNCKLANNYIYKMN